MKKSKKSKKNTPRLHNRLGTLHIMKGNLSMAVNEFKMSLLIEPDNIIALEKMAYLTTAMGDHKSALEYYKKVSELKPEDDDIMLGLANCYEINEDIESALSVLEKLKTEKRNIEKLDFYLSRLYLRLEKLDDALKSVSAAKKLYPEDSEILELETEIIEKKEENTEDKAINKKVKKTVKKSPAKKKTENKKSE